MPTRASIAEIQLAEVLISVGQRVTLTPDILAVGTLISNVFFCTRIRAGDCCSQSVLYRFSSFSFAGIRVLSIELGVSRLRSRAIKLDFTKLNLP